MLKLMQTMRYCFLRSSKVDDRNREETAKGICPMLDFICKNGNATVYQWRTGIIPKEVRKQNTKGDTDMKSKDVDEVRFRSSILLFNT